MAKVGILVGKHSRGTNMAVLARAMRADPALAELYVVVAPSEQAPALEVARNLGAPVRVCAYSPDHDYGLRLLEALAGVDVVCLAGYMRLVPCAVLQRYEGKMLNIHPALLPRHGGKGMYGMRVHEAVIASGDTESGCTVHLVTENYDEGPVVLQLKCPVMPGDTADTLAERVLLLEHEAYPAALRRLLIGED